MPFKNLMLISGFFVALTGTTANFIIERVAEKALDVAAHYGKSYGVCLVQPRFESVRVSSVQSITIKNFAVDIVPVKTTPLSDPKFSVYFREARLTFNPGLLTAEIRGLVVCSAEKVRGENGVKKTQAEFRGYTVTVALPVKLLNPSTYLGTVRFVQAEIKKALKTGTTSIFVSISGRLTFTVQGIPVTTSVETDRKNGQSYFVMDPKTLRKIAKDLDEKLSYAEVDFVSRHLLQAPRLLRIKNYAKRTAKRVHENYPRVPEDAYRHVLWSYLLTREFGPEFSKQVTDAHEIDDQDEDNTEADHIMDYHNNAIGIRYALDGVNESNIVNLILTDKNVIHSPKFAHFYETGRRPALS